MSIETTDTPQSFEALVREKGPIAVIKGIKLRTEITLNDPTLSETWKLSCREAGKHMIAKTIHTAIKIVLLEPIS